MKLNILAHNNSITYHKLTLVVNALILLRNSFSSMTVITFSSILPWFVYVNKKECFENFQHHKHGNGPQKLNN